MQSTNTKSKALSLRKRRIAVVTGTRADYGLLRSVIQAIHEQKNLDLQLFVTGMHLLRRFGYTVSEIEGDGWPITARIKLQTESDDVIGHSRGLGRAITKFAEEFFRVKTDVVLVLGDRLESFAAAAAATAAQRFLAHIHGGDAAVGVQDDAYRHAISKLAHLHFTATNLSKNRLIRLGEEPFRIYQTGSPALDNLSDIVCRRVTELNHWVGFDVREDFVLVLQHPAGGSASLEQSRMMQTLNGCADNHVNMLVLYPNCDPGFSGIINSAAKFCRDKKYRFLPQVPRGIYLGLLQKARALVGNSSGGIIEAGFLGIDVINIGSRQEGRERSPNVIEVKYGRKNVASALKTVLEAPKNSRRKRYDLYGKGRSGRKIASILSRVGLDQRWKQKRIAF